MRKLHKLKKWLTVPESANYLSIVLAEPVSEADVLQLALEDHLTLSVNLVNGAFARKMKIVRAEEAHTYRLITHDAGWTEKIFSDVPLEDDEYLEVDKDERPVTIDGVWDLNLFSNDRFHIERKLHRLTGGPDVTRYAPDEGVYVFSEKDSLIFELLEPEPEKTLDEMIDSLYKRTQPEVGEDPKRIKITRGPTRATDLPEDSVLVVRVDAIRDLEQAIRAHEAAEVPSVTVLSDKERSSLKKQVAALALLLASRDGRYKNGDGPSENAIADDVTKLFDTMPEADKRGVSHTSLRNSIKAGIDLLTG
jgi:hypothetical protein